MEERRQIHLPHRIYENTYEYHPDKLKELKQSEQAASKEKVNFKEQLSSSQVTFEECLEQMRSFPIDHLVAQNITHLIAKMMALDCQPLALLKTRGSYIW